MERKKIAIVGVGLIGGSLAMRLHEKKLSSRLVGVEPNAQHAAEALKMELVDELMPLDAAIDSSDVIILSIPVDRIADMLPKILDRIDRQIVVDLGSTKAQIAESILPHPKRGRYVGCHPMWGTEFSGPSAAVPGAFQNKAVVICDGEKSDADALAWTKHMFSKIGMHLLEMEAAAHDLHAAYVSHISHITSFALANTVLQKEKQEQAIFELASAGFESTVRLAKSNPKMWVPIFMQNRANVIDVLNEHIAQLEQFKTAIESNNENKLEELIVRANSIRRILES
jgi:prephenate dehydrogenase